MLMYTYMQKKDTAIETASNKIAAVYQNRGNFLRFFIFIMYSIQHCFICRPSDSTVPANAGFEPRDWFFEQTVWEKTSGQPQV